MRNDTPAATGSGPHGLAVDGWGPAPHAGVYAALLLASTALLTLEVSLTRLFSYTVWYHLAYLTISVALLGFGASGAIVAAFPALLRRGGQRALAGALAAAALLTVTAFVYLARHTIDIQAVASQPLHFATGLLIYYLVVGAPFLLAGFMVAVPFAAYPAMMGRLYFFDLFGAALGCLLVIGAIEPLGVPGLILLAAALLLAAAAALGSGSGERWLWLAGAGSVVLLIACGAGWGDRLDLRVTMGKKAGVPLATDPAREDSFARWTALGRVDASGWKTPSPVQFWRSVGLDQKYAGPFPAVARLRYDGSNGSDIYPYPGSPDAYRMLDHHQLRLPYLIVPRPNVLVIGVGGGIDMINAVKRRASHVTGVELQPETVKLLEGRLHDFTGGFYDRDDVTLLASEGRHFVRQSDQVFDLIQITAVDTFAAQASGAYVLAESYLYTVEAAEDYLAHLSSGGVLSMVVGDLIYPDTLPPLATRLALIAYRALERGGAAHPERHLMVVAQADRDQRAQNEVVLVTKSPFGADQVRWISNFSEKHGFRVIFAPPELSEEPHQLDVILGSDEDARRRLLDASWFRIDPVYDQAPFFYNVGKWSNVSPSKSLLFLFPGSFVGQVVLVLMVGQAFLLGILLIVLPLLRGAPEGLAAPGVLSYLAYFLGLGVGFMFIEISFVQAFVLFLGSPTYSLSVTIFALLLAAACGSFASTRFADRPEETLAQLRGLVVVLVVSYALGLGKLFAALLHLDLTIRIMVAIAVQLPLGIALGMFMPLGIACVAREHPRLVPWAWGVNGIGSVTGSTLAVLLAMSWGFTSVTLCAGALYFGGVSAILRARALRDQSAPALDVGRSTEPGTPA
ncbi:MAG TPA: hypothetical protein VEI94_05055 [Candidatus Bathyarchaeia archaeon]|nr:hypothetical protein [Candidatus Bathyarchaeia archaeon]